MAKLESARAKLGRARELMAKIGDLVTSQLPWARARPFGRGDGGDADVHLALEDAPVRVALLVGDALQNLNSALDHASWELAAPECRDRGSLFPAISTGTRESESATRRFGASCVVVAGHHDAVTFMRHNLARTVKQGQEAWGPSLMPGRPPLAHRMTTAAQQRTRKANQASSAS